MPCRVLFDTFSSFWWAETVWEWDKMRKWSGVGPHNAPVSVTHYSVPQRLKSTCSQRFISTTGSLSFVRHWRQHVYWGCSIATNPGHLEVTKKPSLLISTNFHAQQDTGAFYSGKQSLQWVRARRTHLLQTAVWTSTKACTLWLWKTGLKEIWLFDTFSANWF